MVDYNITGVQVPNFGESISNALAGRRADEAARQEAAVNQLKLQAWMQDRDYQMQQRHAAAANAAASKKAISNALSSSVVPLPGEAAGPQFPSLENAQTRLALSGKFPEANILSNTQEQFAKQKKEGALANEALGKVDEITLKNEATMSAQSKDAIDMATSPEQLREMVVRIHDPKSPLAAFFARNGVDAAKAINEYDRMVASGMRFEDIRQMMSMGAAKTAEALDKHAKEVASVKLDEARAEAAGQPKAAGSADERSMSVLGKVLTDPSIVGTPEYAQAYALMSSPKLINQVGPNGEMIPVYVKRDLPAWVVPPTTGAAPATAQLNQLPGAQASAVPAGATANTLRMLQSGAAPAATAPSLATTVATRPELPAMVTKSAPAQIVNVPGEGQFVVNPDTKTAESIKVTGQEAPLGREKQAEAKGQVDELIKDLAKNYKALDEMNGMPSERKGIGSNIANYAAATAMGQEVGKALATPAQSKRNLIKAAARDLLEKIKVSTGMSAQELNSNFELENMLKTVTDPTQSIETVAERLNTMSKQFGSGKLNVGEMFGGPTSAPTTKTSTSTRTPPPKAVEMLKKDPSTRGHFDEVFGAGAAAKILGQ